MAAESLSAAQVRAVVQYNPETGEFIRISGPCQGPVNYTSRHGYRYISIGRKDYRAHRLAWVCEYGAWPTAEIDHINGDKCDNRISNLRDVSSKTNNQNIVRPKANNKTGFLGVDLCKTTGLYRASIRIDGKNVTLGRTAAPEDAHALYLQAKRQKHSGCTL